MNKAEIAGIFITGMMVLIALRVPLGAAMFIAGAAGYWWMVGDAVLLYSDGLIERPGRPLSASTAEFADLAANIASGHGGFVIDAPVRRIDQPYGDRNLVCVCPPIADLATGSYRPA